MFFIFLFFSVCFGIGGIGWQAHSWNDYREYNQGFHKGNIWWKIDPHYANSSFCKNQRQLVNPNDPRGCLLLNHDTLVPENRDYHDLFRIWEPLQENAPFLYGKERIYIALCFKTDFESPCDESQEANNWLSLVDSFFQQANFQLSQTKYNLEFILDGSATPFNRSCLSNRWKPWVSTWINGPWEALYSNEGVNGRFQILNQPVVDNASVLDMRQAALVCYGKFANSPFPFLNWEPSDQKTIQKVSNLYLQTGIWHNSSFRFAINIDPIQFQVYSAAGPWMSQLPPDPGLAWNQLLLSKISTVSHYRVSTLENGLIVILLEKKESLELMVFRNNPINPQKPLQLEKIHLIPNFFGNSSIISFSSHGNHLFLASVDRGFVLLKFSDSDFVVEWKHFFSGILKNAAFLSHPQPLIATLSQKSSCSVFLELWKVHSSSLSLLSENSICLGNFSTISSFVLAFNTSNCSEVFSMIAFSDSQYSFGMAALCLIPQKKSQILVKNSFFAAGNSPQFVISKNNFALVFGDGFCWNSPVKNKQPFNYLCDLNQTSTPFILNYAFGPISEFIKMLSIQKPLSACSDGIISGMFNMGLEPSVALFPSQKKMIVVFEGTNQIFDQDCGSPLSGSGLFVNGLPLPSSLSILS